MVKVESYKKERNFKLDYHKIVCTAVAKVLEVDLDELEPDVAFAESKKFKFDSILGLDVLTELERALKVKIGEKYLPKMTSINEIVKVVQEIHS